GAALHLVGVAAGRLRQRRQRAAEFDQVAVAVVPLLQQIEILNDLVDRRLCHALYIGPTMAQVTPCRIKPCGAAPCAAAERFPSAPAGLARRLRDRWLSACSASGGRREPCGHLRALAPPSVCSPSRSRRR